MSAHCQETYASNFATIPMDLTLVTVSVVSFWLQVDTTVLVCVHTLNTW